VVIFTGFPPSVGTAADRVQAGALMSRFFTGKYKITAPSNRLNLLGVHPAYLITKALSQLPPAATIA
jgi:hypothetical protein